MFFYKRIYTDMREKIVGKIGEDIPCGAFTQEKQDMQADRRREYKYRKRFAGDKIP